MQGMTQKDLLHAIVRHNERTRARPHAQPVQIGALGLLIHPTVRPYVNFAWPLVANRDDSSAHTFHIKAEDIVAATRHFTEAGRRPRFEFPAQIAPTLGYLLDQHGYVETRRMPLMAWRWQNRLSELPNIEFRIVQSRADLREHLHVSDIGFEFDTSDPREERLERLWQERESEYRLFLTGYLRGEAMGTAQIVLDDEGIAGHVSAEIVGITTLPDFRRKGIGAAITGRAVQHARQRGAELIFLSSAHEDATRLYARVGFEEIGTVATWVLRGDS